MPYRARIFSLRRGGGGEGGGGWATKAGVVYLLALFTLLLPESVRRH